MYTALKNFAYRGRTYFEGDKVPETVANNMGKDFCKKAPEPKTYDEGE
jgi:hypothetical protein